MVYMVLGNFGKKTKLALCEAEMGPGNDFRHPLSKISRYLEFVINQISYISQQKKINTISHVRQIEGLTIIFSVFKRSTCVEFRLV